ENLNPGPGLAATRIGYGTRTGKLAAITGMAARSQRLASAGPAGRRPLASLSDITNLQDAREGRKKLARPPQSQLGQVGCQFGHLGPGPAPALRAPRPSANAANALPSTAEQQPVAMEVSSPEAATE
ncbi:unnamed protein product, partial [Symbiodinium sp. KB8]